MITERHMATTQPLPAPSAKEGCVWMTENMGKWPSGHRKTEKSGHRLAAEKTLFPRRWDRGYDLRKAGGYLGNVGS